MSKKILRDVYLEKRLFLSEEEWKRRCNIIHDNLFEEFDLAKLKCVHTYLPIEEKNEPDTWKVISTISRDYPHIKLAIPKAVWTDRSLENYIFESRDQLLVNKYGIPEPQWGERVSAEEIDLVLIPLITFDKIGNRIGYGGGFYDRFLTALPEKTLKVGFTIADPLDEIHGLEDTDVPLDICVSPSGVYLF